MAVNDPCEDCTPIVPVTLPDPCDSACLELVNTDCIVYKKDNLDCLYGPGEAVSLRLSDILATMAEYMCSIEGNADTFDVSCLSPTQTIELSTISSIQFLLNYLCESSVVVKSTDCSILVTDSSIDKNTQIFDLSLAWGATTYSEDLALPQEVAVDVVKDGVGTTNCGDYHLNVRTNFSSVSLTQTYSDLNYSGYDTRHGNIWSVAYNQAGVGSTGSGNPSINQVVKTGVNVSFNSGFVLALNATLITSAGATLSGGTSLVLDPYGTTPHYIVMGILPSVDCIPLRDQLFNCTFKICDNEFGTNHILANDPGLVDSLGIPTTDDYERYTFNGVVIAKKVTGVQTQLIFYSAEAFPLTINVGQSIRILASSAFSYNIV